MERTLIFGPKVPEERILGNHQVRLDLARQLRNKYRLREEDPLANLLEEIAPLPKIVMVAFSYDLLTGKRTARVLEGAEREQNWGWYFNRETIKGIVDDSFNYHATERRPKGFFALHKKVGHFRATRAREGIGVESNFAEFESIRFADTNVWQVQNRAAGLISSIMSNPGTIIIRGMTSDIVDTNGRGVRVGNVSALRGHFMGFVDAKLYTDPRKSP